MLEQPAAAKALSGALKDVLWRLVALPVEHYGQAEATASTLVELLLGYEHLAAPLAELVWPPGLEVAFLAIASPSSFSEGPGRAFAPRSEHPGRPATPEGAARPAYDPFAPHPLSPRIY